MTVVRWQTDATGPGSQEEIIAQVQAMIEVYYFNPDPSAQQPEPEVAAKAIVLQVLDRLDYDDWQAGPEHLRGACICTDSVYGGGTCPCRINRETVMCPGQRQIKARLEALLAPKPAPEEDFEP